MAKSFNVSFGGIQLGTQTSEDARPDPETPFHIALMGNFRGRRSPDSSFRLRRVFIDRDNLDDVLAKFDVQVDLPGVEPDQPPIAIAFREMDDFHPDNLFQNLDVFAYLRDLRDRLDDSSTFAAAADEVRKWTSSDEDEKEKPVENEPPKSSDAPPEDLLEQVLSSPGESGSRSQTASDWSRFLHGVVAPYVNKDIGDEQQQLIEQVDQTVGSVMRFILHHPDFQEIESTWRGVEFLVRHLETDESLKLYLIDCTKAELADDLKKADLSATALYDVLVRQTVESPGAARWSVVLGLFTFVRSIPDAFLLVRIAQVAKQSGAPFLAAASSSVYGCDSITTNTDPRNWIGSTSGDVDEAWQILRKLPEASSIGLAAPRVLSRLPYGENTSPTERFQFEEMPEDSKHEEYLWGNPAVFCGYALGRSFAVQGWKMQLGMILEISNLPLHIYQVDGESQTRPCAEAYLTTTAYETMLNRGVIALVSERNRDIVQLTRFQSIADPVSGLAAPW